MRQRWIIRECRRLFVEPLVLDLHSNDLRVLFCKLFALFTNGSLLLFEFFLESLNFLSLAFGSFGLRFATSQQKSGDNRQRRLELFGLFDP